MKTKIEKLLLIDDFAKMQNVSKKSVIKMVANGKLKCSTREGKMYINAVVEEEPEDEGNLIYVVTHQDNSGSYKVLGVFSNASKARYCALKLGNANTCVAPFELDFIKEPEENNIYSVELIFNEDGTFNRSKSEALGRTDKIGCFYREEKEDCSYSWHFFLRAKNSRLAIVYSKERLDVVRELRLEEDSTSKPHRSLVYNYFTLKPTNKRYEE